MPPLRGVLVVLLAALLLGLLGLLGLQASAEHLCGVSLQRFTIRDLVLIIIVVICI